MLVKDYQGKMIPKEKARRIKGEDGTYKYYEEGTSCIKMTDGKWYRTTTGKIIYDHSKDRWVFSKTFTGNMGIVNDGSVGYYSDRSKEIQVMTKTQIQVVKKIFDPTSKQLEHSLTATTNSKWIKTFCINAEVAAKNGFEESIYDGMFYKVNECTPDEKQRMTQPNIPPSEKNNVYSLDDDKECRQKLENLYDENNFPIERDLEILARRYIPFSFGLTKKFGSLDYFSYIIVRSR